MEFVFIFAVVFLQVFFINLFEVVEIIGALGIHAFVHNKVLTVFLWNEGIAAMGTAQFHG